MCITSTLPRELIVTRPLALEMHPAFTAPDERTMLKVVLCANALMLMKLSTRPVTNERLFFTVVFSSSKCFVFHMFCARGCRMPFRARVATRSRKPVPYPNRRGSATFPFSPAPQVQAGHSHLAWV